jgi:ketosteroid isomerase-like protein
VSGENLELAREGYEAMNRGEFDRFLQLMHPDYEFRTGVQVPSIPDVVRREELRAWIQQWYEEPWEEPLQMDVRHIEELEDGRVLALLRLRATGRESGVQVDAEYAHIITFRDGLCLRVDGYASWKQALATAGVADPTA